MDGRISPIPMNRRHYSKLMIDNQRLRADNKRLRAANRRLKKEQNNQQIKMINNDIAIINDNIADILEKHNNIVNEILLSSAVKNKGGCFPRK